MKNGKTRTQKVQVLASGLYKFVKNTKSTRKTSTKKKKPGKTRKKRVTKIKTGFKKTGGGSTKTFHIAANLGVLAVPLFLILSAIIPGPNGERADWRGVLGSLVAAYSGYNPMLGAWQPEIAMANYGCAFLGTAASKLASKFGLNKMTYKGVNI